MSSFKYFLSMFTGSQPSKRRKTRQRKTGNKRRTRRVYKMRGGWGGAMPPLPGVMTGGW